MLATLQTAFKKPPPKPSVKIGENLGLVSLKGLNPACWPSVALADQLRDEVEDAKKRDVICLFVYLHRRILNYLLQVLQSFSFFDIRYKALAPWAVAAAAIETKTDEEGSVNLK